MPRRIATQVAWQISRQLQGGYLKQTPIALQTLLAHPPTPLPARAPIARSPFDTPQPRHLLWENSEQMQTYRTKKVKKDLRPLKGRALMPGAIVYLEDTVRERFYNDHPWETLQPRTLVEGGVLSDKRVPDRNATDLTAWGRNPGPEDVIACTVHLHRNHGLSLSQAYHHTLSSYYALRAEHDHASRAAMFEARAYGANFASNPINGQATSAHETIRGFKKESEQLAEGARYYGKMFASAAPAAPQASGRRSQKSNSRVRNTWAPVSQGVRYLQAALEARDGVGAAATQSVAAKLTPKKVEVEEIATVPSAASLIGLLTAQTKHADAATSSTDEAEPKQQ